MYIEPSTIIKIYNNVPLDDTYEHTLYFDNIDAQVNYFHNTPNIVKFTLSNQSYQRVNRGVMRVEIPSEELYDCNYIAFQNAKFGRKWFYAFISSVEYVNNVTSEITFEIDVMQTYLFNVELRECFVEREHPYYDNPGDNLIPENVDLGEYIANSTEEVLTSHSYTVVVASSVNDSGTASGEIISGVYSGLHYYTFMIYKWNSSTQEMYIDETEVNNLNAFLSALTADNKSDGIVSIFMIPSYLAINLDPRVGNPRSEPPHLDLKISAFKAGVDTLNGYKPWNNKMYTFPYQMLSVWDGSGEKITYRYEDFVKEYVGLDPKCPFKYYGQITCAPSGMLVPKNYKGVALNLDQAFVQDNYPQCAYSIDAFRAWLAQNASHIGTSLASNVFNTASGLITHNPSEALTGVAGLSNTIASIVQASTMPPKTKGNSADGNILVANKLLNFYASRISIKREFAKMIDDYFTKYGYATNELKKPSRKNRKHWTYIKTRNCVLIGNAPADDVNKIASIYNHGITFWVHPNEVGRYSDFVSDNVGVVG